MEVVAGNDCEVEAEEELTKEGRCEVEKANV
jgi:hypothetical protein